MKVKDISKVLEIIVYVIIVVLLLYISPVIFNVVERVDKDYTQIEKDYATEINSPDK